MSAETPVARIVQKAPGAAYGLDVSEATFRALGLDAGVERNVDEGRWPDAGGPVLVVRGRARLVVTGERTR